MHVIAPDSADALRFDSESALKAPPPDRRVREDWIIR